MAKTKEQKQSDSLKKFYETEKGKKLKKKLSNSMTKYWRKVHNILNEGNE